MNDSEQQQIKSFVGSVHDAASNSLLSWDIFSSEWLFLLQSESKLMALMAGQPEPPDHQPGDVEYGMILYWLNNEVPLLLKPIVPLLRELGMPHSVVGRDLYTSWIANLTDRAGVVTSDGTLISTTEYAVLDAGYLYAVLFYLRTRYSAYLPALGIKPHFFKTTPAIMELPNENALSIAMFGDWGTGKWQDGDMHLCPAELVSAAIEDLAPDIVIHLGDVYYYGSTQQEINNLNKLWINGAKASFTLNSNHEMYDGANGYFDTALKNPGFSVQNGTSYFAIIYADWIILGLDSAYFDKSTLYRFGTIAGEQLEFISSVVNKPGNNSRKIIVMTHHNAVSYDASRINIRKDSGSLVNDIYKALGNRFPDYWYYGHLHNAIVYDKQKLTNLFLQYNTEPPNLRCLGHGGIPAGKACGLLNNPAVAYFVQTPVDSKIPRESKRVLNGFAMITLSQGSIVEKVYEVANDQSTSGVKYYVAWHN